MDKIEAVVDAIAYHRNMEDPLSEAYTLKNPILVRSFGRPGQHEIDDQGRRKFNSLISGYRACLFDVHLKISGKSRAGLKTDSCLVNLLGSYGIKEPAAVERIVKFLRKALGNSELSGKTPLSYFMER